MKRLLLAQLLLGLIPSANARVVYVVNHGRINIEERCQDRKATHQIWHMDVNGKEMVIKLLTSLKKSNKTIITLTDDSLIKEVSDITFNLGEVL